MKAVFLEGSGKPGKSASGAIAAYLSGKLTDGGFSSRTFRAANIIRSEKEQTEFTAALQSAEFLVLVFPLYVDALPAPLIRALEIAQAALGGNNRVGLITIVNCGFPESFHNDTALAVCREFARQAGLSWAASLSIGQGGALDFGHKRFPAADLNALADLMAKPATAPALDLTARAAMPAWLYIMVAEIMWFVDAKRHGAFGRLFAKPYKI
ncbi:MAG: hypothetical protein WCS77_06215 [Elusimicrobiaceae bacterium]|jgi:NAD(P)H-dependent FMN reductase